MKYQVVKEFRFEAAHRIVKNYAGKCSHNHGHSWKVLLYIENVSLDEKGMVLDFNEMKVLGKWIDENLDHSTLLWEGDDFARYLASQGHKVFLTKENPTSEHLAMILLEKAKELFKEKKVKVAGIEVSETCTSAAKIFV